MKPADRLVSLIGRFLFFSENGSGTSLIFRLGLRHTKTDVGCRLVTCGYVVAI